MDSRIIGPVALGIVSLVVLYLFFKYYGAFKLPLYASLPMFGMLTNSFLQIIALLPYDISNALFSSVELTTKGLKLAFEVMYWINFCLSWVVMPVLVSIFTYNHALTPGRKIWYSIRHNILFWLIAGFFVLVGVVIMLATGGLKFSDLFPLAIALSNAYGLLLACLLLGYGFVALPKSIWIKSDPNVSLNHAMRDIYYEIQSAAQAIVDGQAVLKSCQNSQNRIKKHQQNIFLPNLQPRIEQLSKLIESNNVVDYMYIRSRTPQKKYEKMLNIKWEDVFLSDLEDFLKNTDKVIRSIVESQAVLQSSANFAEKYLVEVQRTERNPNLAKAKSYFHKSMAILLAAFSAICFWGELALMINPKISLFNFIFTLKIPPLVNILFITSPIICYMIFTSGWSLAKVRLWSLYRFIPGGSNDDTFYFWVVIIVRVAPTIGYHFLLQIGGQSTQIYKALSVMDKVAFLGNSWNIFSPIIMLLIGILVVSGTWDKVLLYFGIKTISYTGKDTDAENGKEVLCSIRPTLRPLIEQSRSMTSGMNTNEGLNQDLI